MLKMYRLIDGEIKDINCEREQVSILENAGWDLSPDNCLPPTAKELDEILDGKEDESEEDDEEDEDDLDEQ